MAVCGVAQGIPDVGNTQMSAPDTQLGQHASSALKKESERPSGVCWQTWRSPGRENREVRLFSAKMPGCLLFSGAQKEDAKNADQHVSGQGICGKSLYLPLNFGVNLTLP